MGERPADVGLEQDDDGEDDIAGEVADQEVDGLELTAPREIEQADDDARPDRHLHGTRAADEHQQLVDHQRHQGDVGDVPPADGRTPKKLGEPSHVILVRAEALLVVSPPPRSRPAPSLRPRVPGRYGRPPTPQRSRPLPCPSRAPVRLDRPTLRA